MCITGQRCRSRHGALGRHMRGQRGVGPVAVRYRRIKKNPQEYGGGEGVVIHSERTIWFELFRDKNHC
jgi:hypothetical protein